jgi:hypothetical protein
VAFLVVELQSPDLVTWTGKCVPASFRDGLAYYRAEGYAFVAGDPTLPDEPARTVTVCYFPNDPGKGYIVHPAAYWFEGFVIAGPLIAAVVIFCLGVWFSVRRARDSNH